MSEDRRQIVRTCSWSACVAARLATRSIRHGDARRRARSANGRGGARAGRADSTGDRIRCFACGHDCPIPEGAVRRLPRALRSRRRAARARGATSAACSATRSRRSRSSTPAPARSAFSFGMLGCDLHCSYCQNWVTSQALRDPLAVSRRSTSAPQRLVDRSGAPRRPRRRQHLQRAADHQRVGRRDLQQARARGLMTAFVSNGNGTPRVLEYLRSVDRSLQGRSQELRRPALSPARRAPRADPRDDPGAARDGHLAGDRHAADPRLQRLARRARAADRRSSPASRPTSRGT